MALVAASLSNFTLTSASSSRHANDAVRLAHNTCTIKMMNEGESSTRTGISQKAFDLQELMQTRRSTSRFESILVQDQESSINPSNQKQNQLQQLNAALERAVQCAIYAPNHKHTEPFTFKRMMAPSKATERLAQIAYEVAAKSKSEAVARNKREKWSNVPAFLVALVGGQTPIMDGVGIVECGNSEGGAEYYATQPLMTPQTERQLEDYACSCAAIQNVLLSLHAEGYGSKWATGPVIRCQAFRDLVGAKCDEMVVGLVMVGVPLNGKLPRKPRKRRGLEGDVLQDIYIAD